MRHISLVANCGNSIQFECGTQRCPVRSLVTTDRSMGKSLSAAMTGQHSLWAMQRLRPPVCAALVVVTLLGKAPINHRGRRYDAASKGTPLEAYNLERAVQRGHAFS